MVDGFNNTPLHLVSLFVFLMLADNESMNHIMTILLSAFQVIGVFMNVAIAAYTFSQQRHYK